MEHLVLKWAARAVLVAVNISPASAQTIDIFDVHRFSNKGSPVARVTPEVSSLPVQFDSDTYTLNASGSAVRDNPTAEETKNRYVLRAAPSLTSTSEAGATGTERENKFSNISLPPECGTSPQSQDEIARLVEASAARYGVDPGFAKAIAWTESRYDQVRNSPKGARGPMQLMPEMAARFGVSDACEPVANIDGGMRYLKLLLDEFKNPLLAAAAYNAGEQSVYDNGGVPPYPETVRYVSAVLNYRLGIDIPRKRPGRGPDRQPSPATATSATVIGARPVTFVGGVMKF